MSEDPTQGDGPEIPFFALVIAFTLLILAIFAMAGGAAFGM